MKFDDIRQGLSSLFDSLAEGWQHLQRTASSALTRFRPGDKTDLPPRGEIDDMFYFPSVGWSMLGGDLFEDQDRLVVRLEVPGMDKQDLQVEVENRSLVVSGEKRFEREQSAGRYRTLQCAYGNFRRVVPLPAEVMADSAQATYRNGVLRIDLPKAQSAAPHTVTVQVD